VPRHEQLVTEPADFTATQLTPEMGDVHQADRVDRQLAAHGFLVGFEP
jgi:hypothetical protein